MSEDKNGASAMPSTRILVIDDEEVIHLSLKRILKRQGHVVEAVLSAQEGLDLLQEREYDLVITDLMMPELNGIELLGELNRRGFEVPVVMITGYPTIRTAVEALRLGAVDYLAKPFTRHELLGPVNRAIRRVAEAEAENGEADGPGEEENQAPQVDVLPGDIFVLREHSWAHFRQDGLMEVGIEASFLATVGVLASLEAPEESDLVEQGYAGFRLRSASGELHSAFMPLSGQVVKVNEAVVANPAALRPEDWLVRILPTALELELELLRRRERSGG